MRNTDNWTLAAILVLFIFTAASSSFADKASTNQKTVESTSKAASDQDSDEINLVLEPSRSQDVGQDGQAEYTSSESPIDPTLSQSFSPRQELKETALSFIGTPYRWGGTTPNAFDCSGFTRYVYKQMGVNIPRTARQQYKAGKPVKAGNWKTGDLVFFDIKKGYVSHVGLYLTSCAFIHASNPLSGVKIDNLKERYYKKYYVGARKYDLT
jgi:cell wall-associated NlpC family hydrolase